MHSELFIKNFSGFVFSSGVAFIVSEFFPFFIKSCISNKVASLPPFLKAWICALLRIISPCMLSPVPPGQPSAPRVLA